MVQSKYHHIPTCAKEENDVKKAFSKLISVILAFALLLALLPTAFIVARAESGKCGTGLTWTLKNGTLTISGTGNMYDYDYDYLAPWGFYGIFEINIDNGVTSIGNMAFEWCYDLESITIPDSVTSIGNSAFANCGYLKSVTIGKGVKTIGKWAFFDCSEMTSLKIGSAVESIGYLAFYNCRGLTSLKLPKSLTTIDGWAFCRCEGLKSVTIPENVTSIGDCAFYNCYNLTSVKIGKSVTHIGDCAFHYYDWENNNDYRKPLGVRFSVYKDSYAHKYAKKNDFKRKLLKEPEPESGFAKIALYAGAPALAVLIAGVVFIVLRKKKKKKLAALAAAEETDAIGEAEAVEEKTENAAE